MFDVGLFEFVVLGVVALLVFGPDRLPRVTAQATHWLRQLREQAQSARQTITENMDLDTSTLKDLADLHPRNIARTVLEPVDEAVETARAMPPASPRAGNPTNEAGTPFDPDAT